MSSAHAGLATVDDGLIVCKDGCLQYVGSRADAPPDLDAIERIDCQGRWITPGLIDCHTHLVYAGNRAREFEQRLEGVSYEQIALAGGGILATVRETRAASEAALIAASLPRLDALIAEGVTTIEVKSGYGLTPETELRQLRAAQALAGKRPVEIVTTFLGAHTVPPEARGNADAYIEAVTQKMIPEIAAQSLAQAVDVFCERIGFSVEQTIRVFEAARAHGLPVKLHADQLSDSGGAQLAARFDALSADHLEYSNEDGIVAMSRAGTVAVLLPGAFYVLREQQAPPLALLRKHGVYVALATDCNPGTSPLTSLLLAMNMGATLFGMTIAECLAGVTREAARALGRLDDIGTLERGKRCDLAIWNIEQPSQLVYQLGLNPLHARIWRGH